MKRLLTVITISAALMLGVAQCKKKTADTMDKVPPKESVLTIEKATESAEKNITPDNAEKVADDLLKKVKAELNEK